MVEVDFNIVTNTYKRPLDLVIRSLEASLAQHPKAKKVILIDQNTPPLVIPKKVASASNFIHVKSSIGSVSGARNLLMSMELQGWIIFCDDDGYLDHNYTEVLLSQILENREIKIFAGAIIRDDNGGYYTPRHAIGGNLNKFFSTKLLMGSNFCVQVEIFKKLGAFDENFGAGALWGSGEETDFAWKAYFGGVPMKYSKELRVIHIAPYASDFKNALLKAFRYGRGRGALVAKWLIIKRKAIVTIELAEMMILPLYQSCLTLLKFSPQKACYPLGSLAGRVLGFLNYLYRRIKFF